VVVLENEQAESSQVQGGTQYIRWMEPSNVAAVFRWIFHVLRLNVEEEN
jgi:hypothetical protein